jgi:hypothetical protein
MKITKYFRHAGRLFKPGMEDELIATQPKESQWQDWRNRNLIEDDQAAATTSTISLSGSTLENELTSILREHAGETGLSEGAVETLNRIISERDTVEQENRDARKLIADMHAAAVGGVQGPDRGVIEDIADIRERALIAEEQVKSLRTALAEATASKGEATPTQSTPVEGTAPEQKAPEGETAQTLESGEPKEATLTGEELTRVAGPKAAISLLNAKLNTREKIAATSDADLEKLTDVGEATVKKLREWLAA